MSQANAVVSLRADKRGSAQTKGRAMEHSTAAGTPSVEVEEEEEDTDLIIEILRDCLHD